MNRHQRLVLEKSFHSKLFPTSTEIHQLARLLNLSKVRIKKWYEGERYKKKQAGLLVTGEECLKDLNQLCYYSEYSAQSQEIHSLCHVCTKD